MQVAIVGLGRMGMNMARRLIRGGHEVIAWNRSPEKVEQICGEGAAGISAIEDLAGALAPPRAVWMMLPAGGAVDVMLERLLPVLESGDIIIDGGNSYYGDDIRRKKRLDDYGIHYLDVGVSGGVWGLEKGYCLMAGGEKAIFEHLEPLLNTLAPLDGYMYCGEWGAGHFVKMIHNGIEYGMMSAYGEGFAILQASPYRENLDLSAVAGLWNRGSVVRSWLLELAETALKADKNLESLQGYVEDSGEGRWTVQQAIETGVPAPVIAAALFQRFRSRIEDSFSDRVLAALRNQFGGHALYSQEELAKRPVSAGAGGIKPATGQD